jgi:hypothetical protein
MSASTGGHRDIGRDIIDNIPAGQRLANLRPGRQTIPIDAAEVIRASGDLLINFRPLPSKTEPVGRRGRR